MSTEKVAVPYTPDPAMEFWPRVEQAIRETGISRADFEWLSGYHNCHKKNCRLDHGHPEKAVQMVVDAIARNVYAEMLCRVISEPDDFAAEEDQ